MMGKASTGQEKAPRPSQQNHQTRSLLEGEVSRQALVDYLFVEERKKRGQNHDRCQTSAHVLAGKNMKGPI